MFRASPWITYEPSESRIQGALSESTNLASDMNQDVDMDAPQISTLREEDTPPPQPTRTSKFRVKLLVNDTSGRASPSLTSRTPVPGQGEDEGDEDEEDEEDQLIDDDDNLRANLPIPIPKHLDEGSKRKVSSKRKPKKTEKKAAEDEKKAKGTALQTDPHIGQDTPPRDGSSSGRVGDDIIEPLHPKLTLKKKPLPRKVAAVQRSKAKGIPLPPKDLALASLQDDGENYSEPYTGTAASSPATFYPEGTPEVENIAIPISSLAPTEEANLEFVPHPIYPLPSKPFPVQPPPKIGTGFAPVIPLDKSKPNVRHWRVANREVRGIAGGRWFARTWVGDKESEFAAANAAAATTQSSSKTQVPADGVALPKVPSISAGTSAGKASSKVKALKSQGVSAAPSRAGSVGTDIVPNITRAPTKMRTIVAAPSSEGGNDSDIVMQGP